MELEIQHTEDEKSGRWFFSIPNEPNEIAYMSYIKVSPQLIIIDHTIVPDKFSGQGIAKKLLKAAIEYMREHNIKANPTCGFVISQINKNPDWQDVLADKN